MITITNGRVVAEFDPGTGTWAALRFADEQTSLLHGEGHPFDLIVDGRPFWGRHVPRPIAVEADTGGLQARLAYEHRGLRIAHTVALDADAPVLRQQVEIRVTGGTMRKLTEVLYRLPGLCVGAPDACLLQLPGQYIPPDTPYPEQAKVSLDRAVEGPYGYPDGWLEFAPDQSSGVVIVENRRQGRVVSAWLYSEQATTFPTLDGDGTYLTVEHRHKMAAWLKPGVEVTSSGHALLLTSGSLDDHLVRFRAAAYGDLLASVRDTPAWFNEARLLQIGSPETYAPHDIVASWLPRLDEVRDLGFTLIQMMPVWAYESNCYCLHDHYEIDGRVATAEELRAFVAAAHERGIRVIFDLIPQGIGVHSPFIQEHESWMVKDELGRYGASHGWGPAAGDPADSGTYSVDWGHPGYQQYVIDWALWNIETFDIDGFRTDAMHHKEPNWRVDHPYPAWQTTFGGVRLAERLRTEMKKIKPEAVLLSEVWGPIFQRGHDATYENGWLLRRVNEGWLQGKPLMSGAQWAKYLALAGSARPAGTRRAMFSANHDHTIMAELARQTPLGETISFMHVFADGFPFVWWEELIGRATFFRGLMAQRRALVGYHGVHGQAHPRMEELFTAVWCKEGQRPLLAVANVSMQPVRTIIDLQFATSGVSQVVFGVEGVEAAAIARALLVEMPPAGYALLEL